MNYAQNTSDAPKTPRVWRNLNADGAELKYALPGVPQDALKISATGREITVTTSEAEPKFAARLTVPEKYDLSATEAGYRHGVLTLKLPLAAESAPKEIAIVS